MASWLFRTVVSSGMRIVSIGDIGPLDGMLHVGDEAMFEAMVIELRSRGASHITGLSSNLVDSADRYGIDAIQNLGFGDLGKDRAASEQRMHDILTGRIQPRDPAVAVVHAVQTADLVVIAGGGNMTSIWPSHIFERATLGALAKAAGVPLVVSGQTLGPQLDEPDSVLLAGLLRSADLVGVREGDSLALAAGLGIEAQLHADDASFLADLAPSSAPLPPFPYCLVTLSTHTGPAEREEFVAAAALLLDRVAASTGLGVVFSGHFAPFGGAPRGDEVIHELVRSAMEQQSGTARAQSAAESAALARGASLVVSSRYHPVVFAVSGGVPAVGIPVDDYTTTKLTGALGNFGQSSVLPLNALLAEDGPSLVNDVWLDRSGIRETGLQRAHEQRAASSAWWDAVAALGVSVQTS